MCKYVLILPCCQIYSSLTFDLPSFGKNHKMMAKFKYYQLMTLKIIYLIFTHTLREKKFYPFLDCMSKYYIDLQFCPLHYMNDQKKKKYHYTTFIETLYM
jgi:hypothetical protein